jgi:hypothetical protein
MRITQSAACMVRSNVNAATATAVGRTQPWDESYLVTRIGGVRSDFFHVPAAAETDNEPGRFILPAAA